MAPSLRWKKSAFSRNPGDTVALILIGSGLLLLPLNLVGAVMLWRSERWTLTDNVIAILPTVFGVIGILLLLVLSSDLYRFFWMAAILGSPVIAFFLAFRMGRHDELLVESAAHVN